MEETRYPIGLDDSLTSLARIDNSAHSGQSPCVLRREALWADQGFFHLKRNAATIVM
jgi:hypothetical protein